ncbi:MAG: energy transducer TonB [Rhodanobacteraceae bacterium]|nr:energy transducer TonB [Rhodanobacteraceae bacterium]
MTSYAAAINTGRINPSRTLAIAFALILHVAALALLFAPLRPPIRDLALALPNIEIVMQQRLIPPPSLPLTVPLTPPRATPAPQRRTPVPVLIPNPEPVQSLTDVVPEIIAPIANTPFDNLGDLGDTFTPSDIGSLSYLDATPPRYPPQAIKRHLEGEVMLIVSVGADGYPEAVSIQRSSGHAILDRAAIDQVRNRWRFRPLIVNGLPTRAQGLVPIRFT